MRTVQITREEPAPDRAGAAIAGPASTTAPRGQMPAELVALAVLSVGAAVIHVAVTGEHFAEDWLYGVFFLVVAWAQLGWAAAVLWRPSRALLWAGVAGNLAIAVIWAVSRTAGLPFGRGAGTPEPVGFADTVCTALEVTLALGGFAVATRRAAAPARSRRALAATAALTVAVVALASASLTPALAGGGHDHAQAVAGGAHAVAGHDAAAHGAATGQAATAVAAQSGAHVHGQVDVGAQVPPTAAQRAAAARLVAATKSLVTRRWPTIKAAKASGFQPVNITGPLVHMGRLAWFDDGRILDPTRPESLVYYQAPDGRSMLLGAMYLMPPGQNGPQVGGSLTRWHIHTELCINARTAMTTAKLADGSCPPGTANLPTPQMLHVWTVAYPGGPFADIDPASVRTAILQALPTVGLR